ncbi:MAG: hypothetical protein WC635_14950 [Bacteriovorax sp.]|jgi:hypothetical protein
MKNWGLFDSSLVKNTQSGIAKTNSNFQMKDFNSRSHLRLLQRSMNLSQNENSGVNSQLKQLTTAYMDKHPGLTLNALAGRCGVPATTMRRLMKSDAEKSELAPHSVLSLVSYLLKEKKISSLLKKIDGPVAELLNRCFDQFIFDEESSSHTLNADLNNLFKDKTTYLIYKLAANQCGTSLEEIKNIFGLLGLQKLSELIDKGWIISDDKNAETLHAREKNFSVDLALAHQLTHSLVDFYKPRDVEAGYNLFYSLSEGMNQEGIKKIKEIEKDAVKKIFDLMNEKKYLGDIPYFAVVISDVLGLTPKDQNENSKGVLQ